MEGTSPGPHNEGHRLRVATTASMPPAQQSARGTHAEQASQQAYTSLHIPYSESVEQEKKSQELWFQELSSSGLAPCFQSHLN